MRPETIAYTRDKPWGKNAVEVPADATVPEMLKASGLAWTTEKVPLLAVDGKPVKGFYALRRSDNHETLDVCGERYIPTQNADAFAYFDEFLRNGKVRLDTMGSLDKGRIAFGLARLDASFTLPGKDKVGAYLFLGVPHKQGRSLIARITTHREVCNNTISIALRLGRHGIGDTFRMNHRNEFNKVQQDKASEVLKLANAQVKEFAHVAHKLHKYKITDEAFTSLLKGTFNADESTPRIETILHAYHNAPGAQPGTGWGALNAMTYWADHQASRSDDRRLTNAWVGKTQRQKQHVLAALTQLASA